MDLNEKTVLITGGTGGIGKQTALTLARMGAHVIITGRSQASGDAAVSEIRTAASNPKVDLLLADLSSQTELRSLATKFKERYSRLDVLINNAGNAAARREVTADGLEKNFAVNVVAPVFLTTLLLDVLASAPDGRVITVTGGDVPAHLDVNNLQAELSFDGLSSYSQSKLAMMAVMYEIALRHRKLGLSINVCYPGQASTAMTRGVTADMLPAGVRWIFPLFRFFVRPDGGKSAEKASRSSVYLASAAEVKGVTGKYFNTKSQETAWPVPVLDLEVRSAVWRQVQAAIPGLDM